MDQNLFIFAISYEGSLFSYEFGFNEGVINPFFNCKDHVGRIKAVHATNDGLVLTSGEDENIKVYNFLRKKQLSNIYGTNGVCTKLLSTPDFALSCHENGQVCVEGKKDFAIYHRLKVFKDSCIDIDLHPSNKLLACLNNKGRFAVWNLAVCTGLFHKKIKASAQMIRFLNDESLLILTMDTIYCFNIRLMAITNEIKVPSNTKINDCVIIREPHLLVSVACENGHVYFYTEKNFHENYVDEPAYLGFKAYNYRVKKLAAAANFVITISTEGDISIWDVSEILEAKDVEGGLIIESYSALYEYKVTSRLVGLSCALMTSKSVAESKENGEEAVKVSEGEERPEENKKDNQVKEPRLKQKINKYRKLREKLPK